MPENADLARFIRIYDAPRHFSKLNICVKIYLSFCALHKIIIHKKGIDYYEKLL